MYECCKMVGGTSCGLGLGGWEAGGPFSVREDGGWYRGVGGPFNV